MNVYREEVDSYKCLVIVLENRVLENREKGENRRLEDCQSLEFGAGFNDH